MSAAGIRLAGFGYRLMMSYILLAACAAYGGTAALVLRLVGMHRISQWLTARAFKWTMGLTTDVWFHVVSGHQHLNTRPAVFVGNHQTALDVLLLGAIFPKYCSVTAKKQLKQIPFLGWFMAVSGTVFIDRGNRSTALKAFEGAGGEIRDKKQSVFIFPEGTRSNTKEPTLLPFKKGAFHLAVQAQVPIVPIVSACYSGVLSLKEKRFRSGHIPVVGKCGDSIEFGNNSNGLPFAVLQSIPTHNLEASDVDQLTIYVRGLMMETLDRLTRSSAGHLAWDAEPPSAALPEALSIKENLLKGIPKKPEDEAQAALRKKIGL
jgi:lysophosphatidate acyltransferase